MTSDCNRLLYIGMLCVVSMITHSMDVVVPKTGEKAIPKEVFLMAVKEGIHFKGSLAEKSQWITQKCGEGFGTQENPLAVPIPKKALGTIRDYLECLLKNEVERLHFEILPDLSINDFADLLIYSKFLEIDDLLGVVAPEFVKMLKETYLHNFEQNEHFLSSIFISEGKVQEIPWNEIIAQLKKWLAQFILSNEEKCELRARLRSTIKLRGIPYQAGHDVRGRYVAICGSQDLTRGFCDVWDMHTIKRVGIFDTEHTCLQTMFSKSPTISIVSGNSVAVADMISHEVRDIPVVDEYGEEAVISCVACSPDHKKVAVSADKRVVIVDLEKHIVQECNPTEENEFISGTFLQFVPHTGLLIDIRGPNNHQFVRIWNVQNGKCLLKKDLPYDQFVKYCLTDGGILWAMNTQGVLMRLQCIPVNEGILDEKGYTIWDPKEHDRRGFTLWEKGSRPLCFHPDGTAIVLCHANGKAEIITLSDECSRKACLQSDETLLLEDGCYGKNEVLATLDKDHKVVLWNGKDGTKIATLQTEGIDKLFWFSPKNNYLFVGSGEDVRPLYYTNTDVADYISSQLSLEQSLFLILLLQGKNVFERPHLVSLLESFDSRLLGRFLRNPKESAHVLPNNNNVNE